MESLRSHFPLLKNEEEPWVYFDNASTTLKPQCVIDKICEYYTEYPVNVHRGTHPLSERATHAFEQTREEVCKFIHAKHQSEIIFTSGTTESINLVAYSFGEAFIQKGDEIVITEMEHHANIVPWKILCDRKGAHLKVIRLTPEGDLNLDDIDQLINKQTKLVALVYAANSLGTVNPIEKIIKHAHSMGAAVLVDAAQAVSHFAIDVQSLNVDFLCFSAHKMFGPTGIGILYGKKKYLDVMPPYQSGGHMIKNVDFENISYGPSPQKFEAGTPSIASVLGLGAAIDFIKTISFEKIVDHEKMLLNYTRRALENIKGLQMIGTSKNKVAVFSFNLQGVHPHDVSAFLSQKKIAIRSGHHCNQPIMTYFCIAASNRVSLSIYNTTKEVDHLVLAIEELKEFFL